MKLVSRQGSAANPPPAGWAFEPETVILGKEVVRDTELVISGPGGGRCRFLTRVWSPRGEWVTVEDRYGNIRSFPLERVRRVGKVVKRRPKKSSS